MTAPFPSPQNLRPCAYIVLQWNRISLQVILDSVYFFYYWKESYCCKLLFVTVEFWIIVIALWPPSNNCYCCLFVRRVKPRLSIFCLFKKKRPPFFTSNYSLFPAFVVLLDFTHIIRVHLLLVVFHNYGGVYQTKLTFGHIRDENLPNAGRSTIWPIFIGKHHPTGPKTQRNDCLLVITLCEQKIPQWLRKRQGWKICRILQRRRNPSYTGTCRGSRT